MGLGLSFGGMKSSDQDPSGCSGGKVQTVVNYKLLAHEHQHEDATESNAEHVRDSA